MFLQLTLATHQADLLACLNLQPGGSQRLLGLRSFLAIGAGVQGATTLELANAILAMIQSRDGASYPLERFVLRKSPIFIRNRGPIVAQGAIAATLTLEILLPEGSFPTGLLSLGSALGMHHPEEQLDYLVKVGFARVALGLSPIDPLRIFFDAGGCLDGRHQSTFSAGILNALEDLDPWRDPSFTHRSNLPTMHPLHHIIVSGLPALLFHDYYRATDPVAGMATVAQRLAELWDREAEPGKRLSAEGKAYAILRGLLTRCSATHLDFWGHWPDPLDHLAAAVGGTGPVCQAQNRLGVDLPAGWPFGKEIHE